MEGAKGWKKGKKGMKMGRGLVEPTLTQECITSLQNLIQSYILLYVINYLFNTGQYWERQLEVNSSFPNLK